MGFFISAIVAVSLWIAYFEHDWKLEDSRFGCLCHAALATVYAVMLLGATI
ncbi:hypothetical protein [Methylorubrum sp. SL192]|uniref:hypothetical protein n=1 Tax=Methylorubrum sp. SL192 TaxID=2995167 RepID=UPI002272D6F4|nr:hypothetical protein [Methylorubrum sp. SL192]MCY1644040.1 hypothetical protein [Methylorubrum sp. SL192]